MVAVQAKQVQPNFKKKEKKKEKQKSSQSFLPGCYGAVDSEINLIKNEKAKVKTNVQTEVAKLK